MFTTAGISTSLDTVLATTLGTTYHSRLKKSNPNLLRSEKSLSNNSSKSSSGSSLTLTNNQNSQNNSANCINNPLNQYPHHQFYCSQISTSANWNSGVRNSDCSQKVNESYQRVYINAYCLSSVMCLSSLNFNKCVYVRLRYNCSSCVHWRRLIFIDEAVTSDFYLQQIFTGG